MIIRIRYNEIARFGCSVFFPPPRCDDRYRRARCRARAPSVCLSPPSVFLPLCFLDDDAECEMPSRLLSCGGCPPSFLVCLIPFGRHVEIRVGTFLALTKRERRKSREHAPRCRHGRILVFMIILCYSGGTLTGTERGEKERARCVRVLVGRNELEQANELNEAAVSFRPFRRAVKAIFSRRLKESVKRDVEKR